MARRPLILNSAGHSNQPQERLRGGGRDVLLDTTALVHEACVRLSPRLHLTGDPDDLVHDQADSDYILRVHEAIEVLQQQDARMAQVVEMRWFGGFSEPEIAQAIGVNERTVRRDWEHARLVLAEALR